MFKNCRACQEDLHEECKTPSWSSSFPLHYQVNTLSVPLEARVCAPIEDWLYWRGQVLAVRKSGRFAWIEFGTLQAAQMAMSLDGESLGNGILKISTSKTPIHTAGWRAPVRSFALFYLQRFMS